MFSQTCNKQRHLNLRMNPRVSCDCDFISWGKIFFKLEEEKKKCLHVCCFFFASPHQRFWLLYRSRWESVVARQPSCQMENTHRLWTGRFGNLKAALSSLVTPEKTRCEKNKTGDAFRRVGFWYSEKGENGGVKHIFHFNFFKEMSSFTSRKWLSHNVELVRCGQASWRQNGWSGFPVIVYSGLAPRVRHRPAAPSRCLHVNGIRRGASVPFTSTSSSDFSSGQHLVPTRVLISSPKNILMIDSMWIAFQSVSFSHVSVLVPIWWPDPWPLPSPTYSFDESNSNTDTEEAQSPSESSWFFWQKEKLPIKEMWKMWLSGLFTARCCFVQFYLYCVFNSFLFSVCCVVQAVT